MVLSVIIKHALHFRDDRSEAKKVESFIDARHHANRESPCCPKLWCHFTLISHELA